MDEKTEYLVRYGNDKWSKFENDQTELGREILFKTQEQAQAYKDKQALWYKEHGWTAAVIRRTITYTEV